MLNSFYPLLDPSYCPDIPPFKLAEEFLSQSLSILQLRSKTASKDEFKSWAQELSYLKIHNQFKLIFNHHIDLVLECDADGVHLPAQSISISEARDKLGSQKIIGCSVHSIEEGLIAAKEGADYLSFGSIFPSKSHDSSHPVQTLEALQELCSQINIPVNAIGGISLKNIAEVKKAGASSFSILSDYYESKDRLSQIKAYNRLWKLSSC